MSAIMMTSLDCVLEWIENAWRLGERGSGVSV